MIRFFWDMTQCNQTAPCSEECAVFLHLLRGKSQGRPLYKGLDEPQSRCGRDDYNKILSLSGIEFLSPSHNRSHILLSTHCHHSDFSTKILCSFLISSTSAGLSKRRARLRSLWRAPKVIVQSNKRTNVLVY